jgi:hypothetical protein
MATVTKDFKVKNGLIVEGTTGTINNYDILTKKADDNTYIVNLIGGTATSANEANKVVKRDANGNFAANEITADLVGDVTGNADTATTLETARTIELTGDVTGSVSFNGSQNVQISTTIDADFATDAEVATAKGEAISDAAASVDSKIGDNTVNGTVGNTVTARIATAKSEAISAAEDYTDTREGLITTAYENYADGAVENHNDLTTGVHGVTGNVVGTTDTQTLSNKTLGSDLAAGGYKVSGLATPTANADAATKSYVDTAVANLVDSAPALLDTLNELAQAIGDDEDFIGTVTASIGEKVAKAGDSMTGNLDFGGTNKVTSLAAPTSNGDAANKLYVDTAESDAVSSANSYTDGQITTVSGNLTTHQNATTAVHGVTGNIVGTSDSQTLTNKTIDGASNTITGIDNPSLINHSITVNGYTTDLGSSVTLGTDDVAEGVNNLYYTDARAKAEAATLLANATKTNIVITKDGSNNLTITAENGVADSTTADLAEDPAGTGTSGTWYFTNARAVSALEAVTPDFPAVELASVAKQVAASATVATASTNTAVAWAKADYRAAEFLVKIAEGSHTEVSKVILTLDASDNVALTEYAMVGTNGSLGSVSADVSGSDVRLRVTTDNNNSTVSVVGTLLV